ncbi:MAG: aminodeoxychorismate/anthranilate synthase component II [Candidatus Latescibacterota bacterium]|nr:MAG: aminodeoxychorismate/anthranilate synthase component II [Candidatus Latescibacterota bacterium]
MSASKKSASRTSRQPAKTTRRKRAAAPRRPLVIIDNYDSFTWNLVQYLGSLGAVLDVHRNDAISPTRLQRLRPRGVVISPGPGRPEDGGISVDVVRRLSGRVPILGVCLGHQAIAAAFGGRVVRAPHVMHGKTSRIIHDGRGIFRGLDNPFVATRYHSLVVERESLPEKLEVTCSTSDAVVMGLKVQGTETWGVQFHPESILTRQGKDLLRNFLDLCGA